MVRTAATGIRVSAGKSSKKVGGTASITSSSTSSKSGASSTKLPPIPQQETPSWQKPITNFFKSNSPVKQKEDKTEKKHERLDEGAEENGAGPSTKKLKFDNPETRPETQETDKLKDDKETTSDKTVPDANKENESSNNREFDEGASTSKE